jgi:hypothetical protein
VISTAERVKNGRKVEKYRKILRANGKNRFFHENITVFVQMPCLAS